MCQSVTDPDRIGNGVWNGPVGWTVTYITWCSVNESRFLDIT